MLHSIDKQNIMEAFRVDLRKNQIKGEENLIRDLRCYPHEVKAKKCTYMEKTLNRAGGRYNYQNYFCFL